jgi:pimeloyl-ACP methyl ester carboxylesterase
MVNNVQSKTYRVLVEGFGVVELAGVEWGSGGDAFLLLHGGAGPASMTEFASLLSGEPNARVLIPTHPGFAGTNRPDALRTVKGLARLYAAFVEQIGARDITVVGNSMGGWIAAEMGLIPVPEIGRIVLAGATGIDVKGYTIPDTTKMGLDELMSLSYHDPRPFRIDPTKLTDQQRASAASNRAALSLYCPTATDPTLSGRLPKMAIPVLVISGESDRIVSPEYGRAFAAAIPGSRFELLRGTGHLPQIETPQALLDAVRRFMAGAP